MLMLIFLLVNNTFVWFIPSVLLCVWLFENILFFCLYVSVNTVILISQNKEIFSLLYDPEIPLLGNIS